ncbi:MAG: deoxyribodipyrimidine photo-lyase [Chromatiales bacterium]|nr:MAG: deoxyribodipyrimidine photo-lyase [Chromatiales bacterium]
MSDTSPAILWFRNDLRLDDHPALAAALKSGRPVLPVFILDEQPGPGRPPGAASRWWLHHSLASLAAHIADVGGQLILRRGATHTILRQLVEQTGAEEIYFTRAYESGDKSLELELQQRLGDVATLRRYGGQLLFEPEALLKKDGKPYRVFTPFWRACCRLPEPPNAIPEPASWPAIAEPPASDALADWQLLPTRPDWAGGLGEAWQPGARGAEIALETFLQQRIRKYKADRDRPDLTGTSRLSPHLRWGEISPRRVWHAAQACAVSAGVTGGVEAFLRQLGWREFSYHLLHQFPQLPDKPLRPEFSDFPWQENAEGLQRWQQGLTGYPIVDAGMRELWATGWMHNRVRMVVGSFLVKDLLLPWQHGERWFWDTLVDADPANNAASWQWVAGCGADAAPFFRVFNPTLQGQKFDPQGDYVRRWIPELHNVPDPLVHKPWEATGSDRPGAGYPAPIVEHPWARRRALAAFQSLKEPAA